jgi:pyruvate/2-oxoglutarate/acetoin dehydrogenase E1 component
MWLIEQSKERIMTYKDELITAMGELAQEPNVIFLGQEISTNQFYRTMGEVSKDKMIEFPIAEDMQMGVSIGLALQGFLPVCMYTRMDFFLLAMNQLVNHLDKVQLMSKNQFNPKIIIRVAIGETFPMHPGPQHTQDFTDILNLTLKNVKVVDLKFNSSIRVEYYKARIRDYSTILIEHRNNYNI